MAGAQRFAIALLAGLMLLSSLPHTTAESNDEATLSLEIEIDTINPTFLEGQSIEIHSSLINSGGSKIYQENPSCDVYITVENQENQNVYTNLGECRNQIRDSIIDSNEIIQQTTQIWDFRNNDNEFVASSVYTITVHHSTMNLSDAISVEFYKKSTAYENIELDVILNKLPTNYQDETYLAQILLKNPSPNIIDLSDKQCLITISNSDGFEIIDSCYSNTELFHPNENIYSGHIIISEQTYDFSQPISFQLFGSEEVVQISIPNNQQSETSETIEDEQANHNNYPIIDTQHYENEDSVAIFVSFDEQYLEPQVENCDAVITVFHDYGEKFLSNDIDLCDIEFSTSENISKKVFDWSLKDNQQCFIQQGKYAVVIQIEEQIFSFDFSQIKNNTEASCLKSDLEANFESTVIDDSIYTFIELTTNQDILRIDSNCLAGIKIIGVSNDDSTTLFCGYNAGNFFTMNGEKIEFSHQFELIDAVENDEINIQYSTFNGLTEHDYASIKMAHNNLDSTNDNFQLEGTWKNIEYGQNECWIINSPNNAHIIDSSLLTTQWSPKEDWTGSYLVSKAETGNGNCGIFGIQLVVIDEIYFESEPESTVVTELEIEASDEIDVVAIAVTGTASASIILALVLLISNTESLRIPVTSLGLWMFALVGKTHETSDGRFQRGRLIGYLTANPGCHFRALMAALKMSNGQITHHLRLLENQELIWRINDGRFVRYYPLNNSLYPGMNPEDLPIPPLSPDPNSLQGKILTLLDDEHQLGEFPTQSELAKKLEKSQQLISHHLRTLQKFGLVEKRKMGIKNRYKLTKEALFLLETDMEFTKVRD